MEDHHHADDVERRMLRRALQHGDADRDHRGRKRRRAREPEMDDDEEERHHGDDGDGRRVIETEMLHDLLRDPRARFRREDGRTEADADAEEHERAPADARLHFLPRHDADARHHHERDCDDGRRGRIERMDDLLRRPEEEQHDGDDEQFLLIGLHRAERRELLRDLLTSARDLLHLRRHELQEDEIEQSAHDDGERRGRDEPVEPADGRAELFLDEAERDHVLCGCRLDADVPDAVRLRDRDEHDGGELALPRHAEHGDDAHDDRHHA